MTKEIRTYYTDIGTEQPSDPHSYENFLINRKYCPKCAKESVTEVSQGIKDSFLIVGDKIENYKAPFKVFECQVCDFNTTVFDKQENRMIEGLRLKFSHSEIDGLLGMVIDRLQTTIDDYPSHESKEEYKANIIRLTIIKSHLFKESYSLTIDDLKLLGIF